MLRQERLKKQRAYTAAAKPPPLGNLPAFSPFGHVDSIRRIPRQSRTVTIGGRAHREVDNGRANVLVPIEDPLFTPAERAAQRDGIVRALFMAEHPLGTLAYGAATMAGAPPRTRDSVLLAGGLAEEAALGGARTVRLRPPSPRIKVPRTPVIRLGALPANNQATRATASFTPGMLGTGTGASQRLRPPGFISGKAPYYHERSHLIPNQLGGRGDKMANLVTLSRPANSPQMRDFENSVAQRVREGEAIEYSTMPLYREGVLPPSAVLMTATGPRRPPTARLVRNPAGHLR